MRSEIKRVAVLALAAMILNGEIYRHGPTLLAMPTLWVFYLAFAATLEEAARRFAWGPRQTALFGAAIGLCAEGFFTHTLYADPPRILGVNWLTVAAQGVYWGVIASATAMYVADRVAPAPAAERRLLGRLGWLVAAWWVLLAVVWGSQVGPPPLPAALPVAAAIAALAALLVRLSRNGSSAVARGRGRRIRILDVAVGAHVAVGVVVGLAIGGGAGPAMAVVVAWLLAGAGLAAVAGATLLRPGGADGGMLEGEVAASIGPAAEEAFRSN